jgi:hypothetical protein
MPRAQTSDLSSESASMIDGAAVSENLIKALSDPYEIPCVVVVLGYVHQHQAVLASKSDSENVQAALAHNDELFLSVMRFTAAPRTDEQRLSLAGSSCSCSPAERDSGLHALGEGRAESPPFKDIIKYLLELVIHHLQDGEDPNTATRVLRADRMIQRSRWPRCLGHMLPYGAGITINSLISWVVLRDMDMHIRIIVLHTVEMIVQYTGPSTIPYLVYSETFMPQGIVYQMEIALRMLSTNHDPFSAIAMLRSSSWLLHNVGLKKCDHSRRVIFLLGNYAAQHLKSLCEELKDMLRVNLETYIRIYDGHSHILGAILNYLTRVITFCSTETELRVDPQTIPQGEDIPADIRSGVWVRALLALIYQATSGRCAHTECTSTKLTTWPLKRCGGCRRMVYCSRRCQNASWNYASAPHREICALIRQFCVDNQLPRTHVMKREHLQPETFDVRLGHRIVEHTERLMACERATLTGASSVETSEEEAVA